MIGPGESHDLLTRAFRGFERAANHLEQEHATLRDEVRRLERELVDAHRRLEAVLDALDTGVAVLSPDGQVLRANRALERMGLEPLIRRARERSPDAGGVVRVRQRNETGARDIAMTVLPVGDDEGTRVVTAQDVTRIRQEEEEGGRRRRLEAMGRMAAELAHEVRNPLGSIRLFASMLREDLEGTPGLAEMAEHILDASASLEATVSNLLAFAAPSRARMRRTDLRTLAREVCDLLAPLCAVRGVQLEGPGSGAACEVWADPEGLRQVLLNLLGNALAATDSGGHVRLRVEAGPAGATLDVVDDGRGIPAEDLPRVFDPFFSRTEGGTGLGLSVVHGIVERHRGTIALDSVAGRGTRVHVELPAQPD